MSTVKTPEAAPQSVETVLPEYRITPGTWLRMMKTLDSLTGNRTARSFKLLMWVLGLLLAAYIVFLSVLVIGSGNASAEHSGGLYALLRELSPQKAENTLGLLLNLFTVAFTGVTALQIYLMKDIDHQEMSHQVFQDNQEYRRGTGTAQYQLELLANELTELERHPVPGEDFNSCYVKETYRNLRAFAFHHEYIGHLVYRNRLNFGITFDTITFPNWLIRSQHARTVINAGRKAYSDFWLGTYHLYLTYEVRRKYNSLYFARRELPRSRENIRACRDAFRTACRNWKKHYRMMPPK